MYWDHMTGWGWAMMIFWSLIWIALLGILVSSRVDWTRSGGASSKRPDQPAQPTARELLDQRLARGDITIDEYHAREKRRLRTKRWAHDERPAACGWPWPPRPRPGYWPSPCFACPAAPRLERYADAARADRARLRHHASAVPAWLAATRQARVRLGLH